MSTSNPVPGLAPAEGYPEPLARAEALLVQARREKALSEDEASQPLVGLALSGGGIRSGTFGLGLIQALAKLDLLRRVDFLSTVSGGGYIGTFLGALHQPRTLDEQGRARVQERSVASVRQILLDLGSAPMRWLRDNGRYLTPGGSGDALQLGVVTLRNWIALHIMLFIYLLTGFLLIQSGEALMFLKWAYRFDPLSVWSPILYVPPVLLLFWILPAGWAYWLINRPRHPGGEAEGTESQWLPRFAWTPVLTVAGVSLLAWQLLLLAPRFPLLRRSLRGILGPHGRSILVVLGLSSLFALVFMALAWSRVVLTRRQPGLPNAHPSLYPRFWLTEALRLGFIVGLVFLGLGLVESLGKWLYIQIPIWSARLGVWDLTGRSFTTGITSLAAALSALAAALAKIRSLFGAEREKPIRVPLKLLLTLTAMLLAGMLLVALATLSQGLLWGWRGPRVEAYAFAWLRVIPAALVGLALTYILGRNLCFLNQSGLGPFYSFMLTRSYLGASNDTRPQAGKSTWVVEGDDVALASYRPEGAGGPLHLLNATVNETVGGASQLVQRDRKGMGLALGPAGMSLGVRHHALWEERGVRLAPVSIGGEGHQVFVSADGQPLITPEALSLGRWMGISGAAVCPGMGSRTNLGQALLLGIFNVRLGHWWDSGTGSVSLLERQIPVVSYLKQEFLGSFRGTAGRSWYLTDGGHFENTAAYELIRRRVPLIIVSDAGQDVDYAFNDLANLVERVRTDFGAEVAFLDEESLKRFLGTDPLELGLGALEDLKVRGSSLEEEDARYGATHAALARISYPGTDRCSTLLLVKPSLSPDLPVDVLGYARTRKAFPQESTGDQFFSESQWESYRRLGEVIGTRLLAGGLAPYLGGTTLP